MDIKFEVFAKILGLVILGNFFGSALYIRALLSGLDVAAVFSRPISLFSLFIWFGVNTLITLVLSVPILYFLEGVALLLILPLAATIPYLSLYKRDLEAAVYHLEKNALKRKLYEKIFAKFLTIQSLALSAFEESRERVEEEKNNELINMANDLRFILQDDIIIEALECLLSESSDIPKKLKGHLMHLKGMSGKLQALIRYANLDILRLILHTDPSIWKRIINRHKIRIAHKGNRALIDSMSRGLMHLSSKDKVILHLNKSAKSIIEGEEEDPNDWSLVGKNCNEILVEEKCEFCPLDRFGKQQKDVSRVEFPCKLELCTVFPLENDYGYLIIGEERDQ